MRWLMLFVLLMVGCNSNGPTEEKKRWDNIVRIHCGGSTSFLVFIQKPGEDDIKVNWLYECSLKADLSPDQPIYADVTWRKNGDGRWYIAQSVLHIYSLGQVGASGPSKLPLVE